MRGRISRYDEQRREGDIAGIDGRTYVFTLAEWRAPVPPVLGADVDFLHSDRYAREIFTLAAAGRGHEASGGTGGHAVGAAGNTGTILGGIGIGLLLLGFFIPVITHIAALIMGLVGVGYARQQGDGTGLVLSRISWIGATVLGLVGIAIAIFYGYLLWLAFGWLVAGSF